MATIKNHVCYKVSADSERGKAIQEFIGRAKESAQRSSDLAKELGAVSYTQSPNAVFPQVGIGSLVFDKPQCKRVYKRIGRKRGLYECIPLSYTTQGKEILKKILELRVVNSRDIRAAFGIPDKAEFAPAWFEHDGFFYLRARYEMGAEYTVISEYDYEEEERKMKTASAS